MFNFFRKIKRKDPYSRKSCIDEIHRLQQEIHQIRRILMATKQDVLDAIAAEKQQVADGLNALNQQIQDLKDQIANGQAVTATDLDEIASAVNDIFIPPTV
jgi:methyl-accepting chemotaxis protein